MDQFTRLAILLVFYRRKRVIETTLASFAAEQKV